MWARSSMACRRPQERGCAAMTAPSDDLEGARNHVKAVLEVQCRLLGDEHPQTLAARSDLAHTLYAQGDLGGARDHQEAVLEVRRRLLGDEHPDTLTARRNLEQTFEAQGQVADGRQVALFTANERVTTDNASGSACRVKVGRNQPCPCGSGKKYKRCCDDPSRAAQ